MAADVQIPADISFPAAVSLTQALLDDATTCAPDQLRSQVSELVRTLNGARGFFVTFLTQDYALPDAQKGAITAALATAPDVVAGLLVKNLVMSTAMVLTHQQQQNPDMAQQSQQVSAKTATVIAQLQLPEVEQEAQQLWQSLTTGTGDYTAFLEKWGYDTDQKQAMQVALKQAFPAIAA